MAGGMPKCTTTSYFSRDFLSLFLCVMLCERRDDENSLSLFKGIFYVVVVFVVVCVCVCVKC